MIRTYALGPIDPQFGGIPAVGVIEEFERAFKEVKEDPSKISIWQVIVSKYHPTFIGECEKAIEWSTQIVKSWLISGMFKDDPEKEKKANHIVEGLKDHYETKSHARHIHMEECQRLGLKVIPLETYRKEENFQDIVLTIHHAYMHTFAQSSAVKIIENHEGKAMIQLNQSRQQFIKIPHS